jgi:hypothetical protein
LCPASRCPACPFVICSHVFSCHGADDHVYTVLKAPTAWQAPETFVRRAAGKEGTVASAASDVFMLGCCYLELATKCTRTPFDWLAGFELTVFRGHDSSRCIGPIQVQ